MTPLANTLAIDREMFSGCVDPGFVLALPFHHEDLEPDCRSFDEVGGAYPWDKNTSAKLCAENAGGGGGGGPMCEGAYLRDSTVVIP